MSDIVQSRFACLPIDGERNFKKKPANKSENKTAKPVSNNGKDVKKIAKKTEPVKVKNNSATAVKQAAKPKKKPAQPTEKDWQKWQEKDEQFLDKNFEEEFRKALEISAKDYQKQKKKTNFISIKDESEPEIHPPPPPPSEPRFSQLENNKSPQTESPKKQIQRSESLEVNEESPEDIPSKLALLDQLESKNKEINQLNSQITTLQKDYSEIKFRYKRLCELLHIGEVREKCQMLVQIDKLTEAQTQSQAEIVSLSAQLEQEKSKVHAMKEGKFVKEKKSVKFDANFEV